MNTAARAGGKSLRQGFLNAGRNAVAEDRTHVQLRGLPKTALPSDVLRLIARNRVENVTGVAIDYNGFKPTGRAYVKIASPDLVQTALERLDSSTMAAMTVRAVSTPGVDLARRSRGAKGVEEAAERGVISGNGPSGGLPPSQSGMNVVVFGLPSKMELEKVKAYFDGFEFASMTRGDKEVIHVAQHEKVPSSRYLVRLASVSEAHRFVRHVHMTYFDQEAWGGRYLMKAKVIY
ncbi:hypothetical protein GLOTRDRAFT_104100 [Gloeophyllum trabeum ATCC 11539]|uniref:RRM domain-containing protein n=1 Tax=Gloeophyllum trabeum (strain ATCC 11539 / FP-39264 / Madison 617) TaxID=670483 RepID=S7QFW4_GLOTA|nr:uncharacterized protein GLOTRDRAFT_104100 [Gloeophyllum trabeum ATCC 11539]EPQ58761.1 hypothetical protein GLOTRDRAFT_104100 [Gloeophyllum trabeum ATCC 11539]